MVVVGGESEKGLLEDVQVEEESFTLNHFINSMISVLSLFCHPLFYPLYFGTWPPFLFITYYCLLIKNK